MTSSNFAPQPSFNDIVFEGRNREYGAYLLRKLYTRNLYRGVFVAVSLFVFLVSWPLLLNKLYPQPFVLPQAPPAPPVVKIIEIDLPVLPAKPLAPAEPVEAKPVEATPATPPTKQLIKPVIAATGTETLDEVVDLPPGVQPGLTNSEGTGGSAITPVTGTGTGTGIEALVLPENKIFDYVEVNPEFPGGEAAMLKYLSEHIRYPSVAERNKVEGLVVVQFVVNEEGRITGLSILKNLGAGTDEEALRVIKNMPAWKPGQQNGRAVKVRYRLPIRFRLQK